MFCSDFNFSRQIARVFESRKAQSIVSSSSESFRFSPCFCLRILESRSAIVARCSSVYSRFVLNGFLPILKGWRGHLMEGHSLTSLICPQQQSMHLARIALIGLVIWSGIAITFLDHIAFPNIFCAKVALLLLVGGQHHLLLILIAEVVLAEEDTRNRVNFARIHVGFPHVF